MECALKISPFYKGIGDNAYTNFFSLNRRKTQHVYRYYSTRNIIEISHPSGANIHISKCYSAKYYSAKCCKGKKFENFWGSISYVWKLICRTNSHTELQMWFAEYHLLHHMHFNEDWKRANLCRTRQHALWLDNILFGIWVKVWSGKFSAQTHNYHPNLLTAGIGIFFVFLSIYPYISCNLKFWWCFQSYIFY